MSFKLLAGALRQEWLNYFTTKIAGPNSSK